MRPCGLLVLLCLATALGACKGKGDASAAPDEAAIKAQQQLVARRDALLAARAKLQADRQKLDVEIKDIQAKGGDASAQIQKRAALDTQLATSDDDIISLLNSKLDAMKVSGDKSAQLAAREGELGARERALADREAKLADRERALADREAEDATRWKDSCTAAAPVIIQQPAKGGNYTRQDVSNAIARARALMSRRGILIGDLPAPTQGLEATASKALDGNDTSRAYFAASQLLAQVQAIHVNRAFIQAKIARLQGELKRKKVSAAVDQQAASILGDVMTRYNDGNFTAANRRLNQLATQLEK